jgi:hypothetical protein
MVVFSNTVLNLARPNHLREALLTTSHGDGPPARMNCFLPRLQRSSKFWSLIMAKNSPAFVRSPRLTSMALLGTLTLTAMFAALRSVKSQQRAERTGSVSTLARPGVAEGARLIGCA